MQLAIEGQSPPTESQSWSLGKRGDYLCIYQCPIAYNPKDCGFTGNAKLSLLADILQRRTLQQESHAGGEPWKTDKLCPASARVKTEAVSFVSSSTLKKA